MSTPGTPTDAEFADRLKKAISKGIETQLRNDLARNKREAPPAPYASWSAREIEEATWQELSSCLQDPRIAIVAPDYLMGVIQDSLKITETDVKADNPAIPVNARIYAGTVALKMLLSAMDRTTDAKILGAWAQILDRLINKYPVSEIATSAIDGRIGAYVPNAIHGYIIDLQYGDRFRIMERLLIDAYHKVRNRIGVSVDLIAHPAGQSIGERLRRALDNWMLVREAAIFDPNQPPGGDSSVEARTQKELAQCLSQPGIALVAHEYIAWIITNSLMTLSSYGTSIEETRHVNARIQAGTEALAELLKVQSSLNKREDIPTLRSYQKILGELLARTASGIKGETGILSIAKGGKITDVSANARYGYEESYKIKEMYKVNFDKMESNLRSAYAALNERIDNILVVAEIESPRSALPSAPAPTAGHASGLFSFHRAARGVVAPASITVSPQQVQLALENGISDRRKDILAGIGVGVKSWKLLQDCLEQPSFASGAPNYLEMAIEASFKKVAQDTSDYKIMNAQIKAGMEAVAKLLEIIDRTDNADTLQSWSGVLEKLLSAQERGGRLGMTGLGAIAARQSGLVEMKLSVEHNDPGGDFIDLGIVANFDEMRRLLNKRLQQVREKLDTGGPAPSGPGNRP